MTIRITPLKVVLLLAPLLLIAFGLIHYDGYWVPTGRKGAVAAHVLIAGGVTGVLGVVLSYVPLVHDLLGQSFWYKLHFVRSSPAQASIVVLMLRYGALLGLWAVGVLAAMGRG